MDDLAQLAAAVTDFAAGNNLIIVPAVPEHDYGPEVCLGPDALDLPGFLALAGRLGGGVLYLRAAPFDPGSDDDQPDSPPAHLLSHKGHVGQVGVAFAAGGLVHFWEHQAAWYQEWQELPGSQPSRRDSDQEDTDGPERLSAEERARLASELAGTILAGPRFRAAPRGDRQGLARLAIPEGTDRWVGWDAVREACDRAHEMAQAQYDQLTGQLDDLAAELLASPEYQQASSSAARKHAAERFLIPRAAGFSPPTLMREELYARAQRLAKAAKSRPGGLF
ncbi:MAG TPA: hypothetical protein VF933_13870 [Streptosporangiaceae bacterium]